MDKIYLDSCIVIYLVERHPVFAPVIETALLNAGDVILATSPLVRLEVLVKPRLVHCQADFNGWSPKL